MIFKILLATYHKLDMYGRRILFVVSPLMEVGKGEHVVSDGNYQSKVDFKWIILYGNRKKDISLSKAGFEPGTLKLVPYRIGVISLR